MTDSQTFNRSNVAEYQRKDPRKQTVFIIENAVYDVTKFLDDHPGGSEVLAKLNGKDASEEFYDIGHSSYAKELMEEYRLGDLAEEDRVEVNQRPDSWAVYEESLKTVQKPGVLQTWGKPAIFGILIAILYTYFSG